MRRSVMAVDTIHASFLGAGNLFRAERSSPIVVISHVSVAILDANPGNDLSLLVGCYEGDFISEVHMPMNPCHWTTRRIATADVNQHPSLTQGVLLIVSVMIERL